MTEIFLLVWVFVSAADGDTLIVRDGSLDPLKPPIALRTDRCGDEPLPACPPAAFAEHVRNDG